MKEIQGSADLARIECVDPRKDKWKIRWNEQPGEEGGATYMEEDYDHRPTLEEVKATIIGWFNRETDKAILEGFRWEGMEVWLSQENQFNYAQAYTAAKDSAGATLPVEFKFGTDAEPKYHQFTTIEELADFYYKSLGYVKEVLARGWRAKDNFDWSPYQ